MKSGPGRTDAMLTAFALGREAGQADRVSEDAHYDRLYADRMESA